MKNKKKILTLCIIAVGAALAVTGFIILPETLTVQITASGQAGNTMPKALGVLIPLAVSAVFAVLYFKRENDTKSLWISLLGIALYVPLFIFNL